MGWNMKPVMSVCKAETGLSVSVHALVFASILPLCSRKRGASLIGKQARTDE